MFTALFIGTFVWFLAALLGSMVECIKQRKLLRDKMRLIALSGTVREMKQLCKGNTTFAGYSRLNKAQLSQFILARI